MGKGLSKGKSRTRGDLVVHRCSWVAELDDQGFERVFKTDEIEERNVLQSHLYNAKKDSVIIVDEMICKAPIFMTRFYNEEFGEVVSFFGRDVFRIKCFVGGVFRTRYNGVIYSGLLRMLLSFD